MEQLEDVSLSEESDFDILTLYRPNVLSSPSSSDNDNKVDSDSTDDDESRLRAGADKDEDDEQIEDLEDEVRAQPKLKKKQGRPSTAHPESEAKVEHTTKFSRIFNIIKIIILFLLWLLTTIFLVGAVEKTHGYYMIAIQNNNYNLTTIPLLNYEHRLGVELNGPFVVQDELNSEIAMSKPSVITILQFVVYTDDSRTEIESVKNISNPWQLSLQDYSSMPISRRKYNVFNMFSANDNTKPFDYSEIADIKRGEVVLRIFVHQAYDIGLLIEYDESPINRTKGIIYGILVLLFLYVLIIWEITDRTLASILASTIAIGVLSAMDAQPTVNKIMTWVDVETLLLLFGMMVLVAVLSESGIFDYLAVIAYKVAKGEIWPLINTLCIFTTVLSTILDNVTMMLLVTPVTIRLCEVTDLNPIPVLMSMVLFSNVGSALTPVGDPPNIIITTNSYISSRDINFINFVLHMFLPVMLAMIFVYIQIRFVFRKVESLKFKDPQEEALRHEIGVWEKAADGINAYTKDEDAIREVLLKKVKSLKAKLGQQQLARPQPNFEEVLNLLKTQYPIRNRRLLIKASVVFLFVLMTFVLHSVPNLHHLSLGWTALIGALLLLILADVEDIEAILCRVEWSTLIFFSSLFILMEALGEMGIIDLIGDLVVALILRVSPEMRLGMALLIVLWVTAIASAFLDNIPVTTMMVKIIISLAENKDLDLPLHPLVYTLAIGACFGGNGTLIGASANVVSAGVIEQHGYKFSFVKFFVIGFPVMLTSVFIASIYLTFAHSVFHWN